MSTAVKRACDACHRRKVKCDGINPCRNCSSAQLSCTYNAIPQKKGPKGSRAKVISELRETQRQSSLSAKIHSRMNGSIPPSAATLAPTPGLLTNEMVRACVDFFFANMYPAMPILSRQRLEQDAMATDTTFDTYCLLSSLSAFMMLQPGMSIPGADPYGPEGMPGATIVTATLLLDETIRVRKGYDYLQNPNLHTLATSYFLFGSYYGLDMQDKAWLCLREATSLVHLVHMNNEDSYLAWDNVEASCRRRLYWLLFVAERAYALQHGRPLSLKAGINPPSSADNPNLPLSHQLVGFCRLVVMFRPFDDSFVDLWNKTRSECSPSYIASLRKQHADVLAALATADPQLSDAMLNQRWLQALAWQINLANGNGTSPGSEAENYQYSMVDVSREIVPMAAAFSAPDNTSLLRSGLIETLLTITSDLTNVLSLLPSSSYPFANRPDEYMKQLFNILAMLRVGEHRFTPLLLVKVHEILPRLANPMLQSPPETSCEMDIFDGFGSAGMAQPPCLNMDEYKAEGSGSVATPLRDVNSPFTSPPPILSPSMDFAHDFVPMSDMLLQRPLVGSNLPLSLMGAGAGNSLGTPRAPAQLQLNLSPQMRQPQLSPPPLQQQQTQQTQQQPQLQLVQYQKHAQYTQQQLSHQNVPQQQQQQPQLQQQLQLQRSPVSAMRGINQSLGSGNTQMQHALMDHNVNLTANIDVSSQRGEPADNIVSVLGNQTFGSSVSGMSTGLDAGDLDSCHPSQRHSSFAVSSQQFRVLDEFQILQRANGEIGSLGSLDINSLHTNMDFRALR